jgi:chromosome segregation ATPase
MTETRAQKLMKIAREVPENSRLSLLPISKIQEILSLPEPQREAMAERVQAEDMTVKQLRDEIAAEKRRSEQLRTKYNGAISDRLGMQQELNRKAEALAQERQERQDERVSMEENHRAEVAELRKRIAEAKAAPAGISPEAQQKIDELEAKLKDAERIADQQAELRQQTLQALREAQSRASRGGAAIEEDLTAEAVITAARTFISCVGYLPHSTKLAAVNQQDRQAIQSHVEMVAKWAEDMRAALDWGNVIVIEGA